MKEIELIYNGFHENDFCFIDSSGKIIRFVKAKKELIEEFDLLSKRNCYTKFKVKYFNVSTILSDIFIITDLYKI